MANIYDPSYDELRGAPGFEVKRSRLGYQRGMERLGLRLYFRERDAVDYSDGEEPPR